MRKTGFTTTIPLEILLAAGRTPVDLNNLFITGGKSLDLIETAEAEGFPRNVCNWIKGIYAAALESGHPRDRRGHGRGLQQYTSTYGSPLPSRCQDRSLCLSP